MKLIAADEIGQSLTPLTVPVWDLFVRLSHWSLVATVLTALATGLFLQATWLTIHVVAGTTAVAIVAARIVWGFLGPPTARFADFVRGPRSVFHHLTELRRRGARRSLGHNPAGGVMVVMLLAAIFVLAASGVAALGGSLKTGPLAFVASFAAGEFWRSTHQLVAYGLIVLVTLHVGGALFESWRTRENLVRTMVDGRKIAPPNEVATLPGNARPLLAMAISATILGGIASLIVALSRLPALGTPAGGLDPAYVEECGACHQPFHPSLAPAATWSSVVDGLADHFGENATLDPPQEKAIRDYLTANSAEAFDSKAANRLRRRDLADPISITATPFWRRAHRHIPDSTFATKAVASRDNCGACHGDAAAGLFSPFAIAIPQETVR